MAIAFDIIEYMSGLTSYVLDESILKTIALERGVDQVTDYSQLTERDRDLIRADILLTVYMGPYNLPSFQHQHGQFSTSTGQQTIKDKDSILALARRLYKKWGDAKIDELPTSSLQWMF